MLISIISATVLDLYMLYIWFKHAQKQKLVLRYSFNSKIWFYLCSKLGSKTDSAARMFPGNPRIQV